MKSAPGVGDEGIIPPLKLFHSNVAIGKERNDGNQVIVAIKVLLETYHTHTHTHSVQP